MQLKRAPKPEEDPERLRRRAAFLRELTSSLRAGLTLPEALASWVGDAEPDEVVRRVRSICALHLGPGLALDQLRILLGSEGSVVRLAVEAHARLGGDLGALLDAIAMEVERRADDLRAARSHAAGALASARTIAFLPLGGLAVTGFLGGSPEGPDALLAVTGIALGLAGFRWLDRLLPRPSPHDPTDVIPALLAVAVTAGTPLRTALEVVTDALDDPDLNRARRAARLGLTWPDALLRSTSRPLADLGRTLTRRVALGLPVREALDRHTRELGLEARRAYEAELRRAPVRMVLPLGLCVLPGFVLVTFGPLLRSILAQT